MRAIRRWWKRSRAERRIAPRRDEVAGLLAEHLGRPVTLRPAGMRGQDSVYFVADTGGTMGVLRLANPWLERPPPPASMPYLRAGDRARLDREWECYTLGARAGLTPEPLWRGEDALLCSYVPDGRMSDRLLAERHAFWQLICAATRALRRLHDAGVVHMDACLANILASRELERFAFIDFEYGPAPGLGEAQQRAYDYLRLAESSLKFMPAGARGGYGEWIETLDGCLDDRTRHAELAPLAPALSRLLAADGISPALGRLFHRFPG